ncbi:MAG TPA: sialidase family protein, partial [Propionibacteriaceae bacterium]|nr:sialidase family protein [Propionibacteriaceae bacterium]
MREVVLAERGTAGYRQYRIPALVVLPSGRVLAAYDGRATVDDLPGPIDVVCRHSDDNGLTWSPQRVLRGGRGLEGFGDPSLLVDAETGRVFAFYAATRLAGFFESRVGADDDPDVEQCGLSVSDDDGLTWQHRRLTPELKDLDIAAMFAASGMGIQVAAGPYAGRLVQPYVVRRASGGIWATMVFSDDHGQTWRHGELVGPGANENAVACLRDGTLLLHSRATPHRLVARSTD